MNIEAVKQTAVCRFDEAEGIYIVESPLLEVVMGADPSESRAWEIFEDLLEAAHEAYLSGKTVGQYVPARE